MFTEHLIEFYDSEIKLFLNDNHSLIGAKSLVSGMRLSWPAQHKKIKQRGWCSPIATGYRNSNLYRTLGIHQAFLDQFMLTINLDKVEDENKSRVSRFVNEFPSFIRTQIRTEKEIELEEYYLSSRDGLKQLLVDSIIKLGNDNAIQQIVDVIFPMIDVNEKDVIPFDQIYLLNPVYDMAEKTADRRAELKEINSKSPFSRLEEISQKVRKYDSKLALEITKISKDL